MAETVYRRRVLQAGRLTGRRTAAATRARSEDAVGSLHGTDIAENGNKLAIRHAGDRFHVAKLPVMGAHAFSGGDHEGAVAMMAGMIDAAYEGRAGAGTPGSLPVTRRAIGLLVHLPEV